MGFPRDSYRTQTNYFFENRKFFNIYISINYEFESLIRIR